MQSGILASFTSVTSTARRGQYGRKTGEPKKVGIEEERGVIGSEAELRRNLLKKIHVARIDPPCPIETSLHVP